MDVLALFSCTTLYSYICGSPLNSMVLVFVSSFYISLLLPRGYGFLLFTSNLSDTCPSFLASRVDELLVFFFSSRGNVGIYSC